jgi:hypothetical protein
MPHTPISPSVRREASRSPSRSPVSLSAPSPQLEPLSFLPASPSMLAALPSKQGRPLPPPWPRSPDPFQLRDSVWSSLGAIKPKSASSRSQAQAAAASRSTAAIPTRRQGPTPLRSSSRITAPGSRPTPVGAPPSPHHTLPTAAVAPWQRWAAQKQAVAGGPLMTAHREASKGRGLASPSPSPLAPCLFVHNEGIMAAHQRCSQGRQWTCLRCERDAQAFAAGRHHERRR